MIMARLRALLLLLALGILPIGEALAELVVVVNARTGVAVMTRAEVMHIFFGRSRQFFNGMEAKPVDLVDSHPNRARFYQQLVGKDLSEVNAYWARLLFSGRGQPPVRLANSDEVMKWVAANPGGIGFVEPSKVDARVKVVFEFGR
jgi:hypothetical protein